MKNKILLNDGGLAPLPSVEMQHLFYNFRICKLNLNAATAFLLLLLSIGTSYAQKNPENAVIPSRGVQESGQLWQNEPFGRYDQSQEILEKRDAFSKHFSKGNGTIEAHVASGPIHYQENDQWKTIFHTIVPSASGFENVTNSHKTYYPATSAGSIKTILGNGSELKDMAGMRMYYEVNGQAAQLQEIASKSGNVAFNQLTYPGVYGAGIDLRLTQNTTQRKMDYIIQDVAALGNIPSGAEFLVFEEIVEFPSGWRAELIDNAIFLFDASGKVQAFYNKPDFYEQSPAKTKSEGNLHQSKMTGIYEIAQNGNSLTILTKVPLDWLNASDRQFPVVIDPTVNVVPDAVSAWTGNIEVARSATGITYTNTTGNMWSAAFYSAYDGWLALGVDNYNYSGTAYDRQAFYSWAKFNTTSITDGSTVSNLTLNTYVSYNNAETVAFNITPISNDPVAATNGNRLIDIRDGTPYNTGITDYSYYFIGWRTAVLGGAANTTFASQLTANWFGVGYQTYGGVSYINDYLEMSGWNVANKPYISVTYTVPCTAPAAPRALANIALGPVAGVNGTPLLPDANITAFSCYSGCVGGGHEAWRGRVFNSGAGTQAWATQNNVLTNTEYVQYDLGSERTVSGVALQGRGDCCSQWVTSYTVQHSVNGSVWTTVPGTFTGNTDMVSVVTSSFTPVSARYVRIYPAGLNGHMSMRAEIIVHPCSGGSVSMSAELPANANTIRWYDAASGGTLLYTGQYYTTTITGSTTFYAEAYNTTGGCGSATRTAVTATVLSVPAVAGTLTLAASGYTATSGNTEIAVCPGTLVNFTRTGGTGTAHYWAGDETNVLEDWDLFGGAANGNSFSYTFTRPGIYLIRLHASNICGEFDWASASDVRVFVSPVNASAISSDQTICYNSTPAQLTGAAGSQGAGAYTYLWLQSTDNGITWSNAAGTNSGQNYSPPALIANTLYKRRVTSNGCLSKEAELVTWAWTTGAPNYNGGALPFAGNANTAWSGNGSIKKATAGWGGVDAWSGGSISQQSITKSGGYIEFEMEDSDRHRMCGLGNSDTDPNWTSIEYAIYNRNDGLIEIYESGVSRGTFGTYARGDIFKISVENLQIKYYKNDVLFYTSLNVPTLPLYADVSIFTQGSGFKYVRMLNPVEIKVKPTIPAATASSSTAFVCAPGTATLTASGLAPGGQVFSGNGTNSSIEVIQDIPEANFTFEMWIKTSAANTGIFSVSSGAFGAGGHDRHLFISGGTLCARVYAGGAWNTNYTINDNQWHHIALTVQTGVGQKMYVDGSLVGTNGYGISDFNWQDRFYIGYSNDGATPHFNGQIDNVRIWSTVRTQPEIYSNINLQTPSSGSGLVYHANLNGNATATVGTNGTAANAAWTAPTYYTYTWSGGPSLPTASTNETQTTGSISTGGSYNYAVTASVGACPGTISANVPVTVNAASTAVTDITGNDNICHGFTTTLTASGGITGSDAVHVWQTGPCNVAYQNNWVTQPFSTVQTTVNSVTNGILNVTSTGGDPMIIMDALGSFNPATYRYLNIRYRVTSGTASGVEIFFYNTAHNYAVGGETGFGTLISDNQWRILSVDMWQDPEYLTGGNILGWRFDWCTASGVTMEFDFVSLEQYPIVAQGTTYAVSPTASTTYYVSKRNNCGSTSCYSESITLPVPDATIAGTATATCLVSGGSWVHFYDNNGKLIVSINPAGNNLGLVTANSYDHGSSVLTQACGTGSNPTYTTAALGRSWRITPTNNLSANIRFPFEDVELSNLVTASAATTANIFDNVSTIGNLKMSRYSGTSQNGSWSDNCADGGGILYPTQVTNGVISAANNFFGTISSSKFVQFATPGFSEFWIHNAGDPSALPVELTHFSATCNNLGEVDVNWTTASEQNSQKFILEKSRDLNSWTFVSALDAAGNANYVIDYNSTDADPFGGVSYYRLIQVDFDGAERTYGPISVSCSGKDNSMIVFPNPTNGNFTVEITSTENVSNAAVELTDLTGKVISTHTLDLVEGKNQILFDEMGLQMGTYIIQLISGSEFKPVKVVLN